MDRLLRFIRHSRQKGSRACICAFIPQGLLQNFKKAEGIDDEIRESIKETLEIGNEEVTKERDDVGDGDKDPHRPDLPDPDVLIEELPKLVLQMERYEKQSSSKCAEVYICHGQNCKDPAALPGPLLRRYHQALVNDATANGC